MPLYTCQKCGYNTINKTVFTKHQQRKFPCKDKRINDVNQDNHKIKCEECISQPILVNISKKSKYECKICNKFFSTKSNLNRHVKNQHKDSKKNNENDLLERIKKLEEENKKLKVKLQKYEVIDSDLVNFGDETTDHLTNQFMDHCCERPYASVSMYVAKVYFNNNVRQNKTINYKNERSKFIQIYNKKRSKWEKRYKEDVLEAITDKAIGHLCKHFEKNKQNYSGYTKKMFNKFTDAILDEGLVKKESNKKVIIKLLNNSV